jgi:phosphoenolpyruvate-protein kinase (PTS system EI component)
MPELGVTPFVPGLAQGVLRQGRAAAAPDAILVLRPDEIAALHCCPAGVILIDAAPFGHATLRLLELGVPAVLADADQLHLLAQNAQTLLDGERGRLVQPPPALAADPAPAPPEPGLPLRTADGVEVELRASVGSVAATRAAREKGAAAIGLVRSEYLFPADGSRPDADFLAGIFREICDAAAPLAVTFRLLDIAGDKRPPWMKQMPVLGSALGQRGARLYATQPVRQVYLDELAALARLTGHCRFAVLLPYLANAGELATLAAEIRRHLPPEVPLGAMLETPAAALGVDAFLDVADFAALGCNDLMQCLFAADRDRPESRSLLDPHAPALYRFLDMVARRAGAKAAKLQVCGLLPQWPGVLPVLIGLGYRVYSVDPVMIPWLARTVRQTEVGSAEELARAICDARHPDDVRCLLGGAESGGVGRKMGAD